MVLDVASPGRVIGYASVIDELWCSKAFIYVFSAGQLAVTRNGHREIFTLVPLAAPTLHRLLNSPFGVIGTLIHHVERPKGRFRYGRLTIRKPAVDPVVYTLRRSIYEARRIVRRYLDDARQ